MEAPKLIEVLGGEAIVLAACGRNHTLALTGKENPLVFRISWLKWAHFASNTTAFWVLSWVFCLAESGSVFAFGENKMGQLGLGNQTDAVPSPTQVSLPLPVLSLTFLGEKTADLGFFFH